MQNSAFIESVRVRLAWSTCGAWLLSLGCGGDAASGGAGASANAAEGADAGAHQGATADAEAVGPLPSEVTYYQHVKPIVDAKCVRCHVADTVAPFALDSYELAKQYAASALVAIQSGSMPPWIFDNDCNSYRGNYSLSEREKALFEAWVEQDTPEGDPKKPAPALDLDATSLSRVDVSLRMPEPYTPQLRPDEYRCFPVAWPEQFQTTKYMTGFKAVPGNLKVVHHVEIYKVGPRQAAEAFAKDDADPGPGYGCFSGPGVGDGTIGGWAPGGTGYDYPEGVGIEIEPGSVIIIQIHYNTSSAEPAPDVSGVDFKVDDDAIAGGYDFWTDVRWSFGHQMPIPSGMSEVSHTWTEDPTVLGGGRAIRLHSASIHMHNLGARGHMILKRADGSEECVVRIPRWDFNWQTGARFAEPIAVHPGDRIELRCVFDNSADNQPIINGERQPPRDVNWGEGTADEMCLGILQWSPL